MMETRARRLVAVLAVVAFVAVACQTPPTGGGGGTTTIPTDPGPDALVPFVMIDGLSAPTSVEIAPDGRVFVAEQSGRILTYDTITDPTPTVAADLTGPVRRVAEHGLLGIALDADYPTRPYMYALHTWDSTGLWGDNCKPDYAVNGCVTGGRISRLTLGGDGVMTSGPDTIVDDRWCFQFSTHGVGDILSLDDGSLVASAGDGASFAGADYGQKGGQQFFPPIPNLTPKNPCGDPPVGVGGQQNPVTSEGGAFRTQDVLTEGDPVGWNGAVIRIDADTGEPMPDNPLVGVGSPDDDAVIAHGLRNPYRMVHMPETGDVYVADVGQGRYEEINEVVVGDDDVPNFGWPCYEGPEPTPLYEALGNQMCDLAESPGARTTLTDPWYAYNRIGSGGAISAVEVVPDGHYDPSIVGELVYSDYVLAATFALGIEGDGSPDPDGPRRVSSSGIIVDLEAGPDGYLYAVDYAAGTVSRLVDANSAPVARLDAVPIDGSLPLTVALDASGSEQPGGGSLDFAWDLDDDGAFDDGTDPTASVTLTTETNLTVKVRVTNERSESSVAEATIYGGNTAPQVTLDVESDLPWSVGVPIEFEIEAEDAEDGELDESSIDWALELHHCYDPEDCHMHPYTFEVGSDSGSVLGPSHGYPSFLRLVASATDSRGQTTTVSQDLLPAPVELTVTSDPPGAVVNVGEEAEVTPFVHTLIEGDTVPLGAVTPQEIGGVVHEFSSWSTGADISHEITVDEPTTVNLTMTPAP